MAYHPHRAGDLGGALIAACVCAGTIYSARTFYRAWIRSRGPVERARRRPTYRLALGCVVGGILLVAAPVPGMPAGARGVFAIVVGIGVLLAVAAEADASNARETRPVVSPKYPPRRDDEGST